jgi:hypothetical protein
MKVSGAKLGNLGEIVVAVLIEVGDVECEVVVTICGARRLTLVEVGSLGRDSEEAVVVLVTCSGVLEHGVAISDTEMTGAACVDKLRTPLVPTG